MLCNSRALSFPHWEDLDEHPLILGLDFSQIAMGVSLSQDQLDPEDGTYKERVIAVRGRTNRGPSCNYSPHRGELSALMFALETYGHLLISHQFVVRTDSMSVKHLNTLKTLAGVYARNAEVLVRYDMILVHRPGKLHYLEDAVSRIATHPPVSPDQERRMSDFEEDGTTQEEARWKVVGALLPGLPSQDLAAASSQLSPSPPGSSPSPCKYSKYGIYDGHFERGVRRLLDGSIVEPSEEDQSLWKTPSRPHRRSSSQDRQTHPGELPLAPKEPIHPLLGGMTRIQQQQDQPMGLEALDPLELVELQEADPLISQVRLWVQEGLAPTKLDMKNKSRELWDYWAIFETLELQDDILVRVRQDPVEPTNASRTCIPESMKHKIVHLIHTTDKHHLGVRSTQQAARKTIYFPGQFGYIKTHVLACSKCVQKRPQPTPHRVLLHPQEAGYRNERIAIDLVSMPTSSSGHKYLLTVLDIFSRFLEVGYLKSKKTEEVALQLENCWFARYGPTNLEIHSDRGGEFDSDFMKQISTKLQIKHTFSPSQNPRSNPVERHHADINKLCKTLGQRAEENWPDFVPGIVGALNANVSRATGYSPNKLFTGHEANSSIEYLLGSPNKVDNTNYGSIVSKLATQITALNLAAHQNLGLYLQRRREKYDKNHPLQPLEDQIGKQVWYFSPVVKRGTAQRFSKHWTGPYSVEQVYSPILMKIRSMFRAPGQPELSRVCTLDRVLAFHPDSKWTNPEEEDVDAQGDDDDPDEHGESLEGVGEEALQSHLDAALATGSGGDPAPDDRTEPEARPELDGPPSPRQQEQDNNQDGHHSPQLHNSSSQDPAAGGEGDAHFSIGLSTQNLRSLKKLNKFFRL